MYYKVKKAAFVLLAAGLIFMAGMIGRLRVQAADHISVLDAAANNEDITVKKYGDLEDGDYSFHLKRTDHTTCVWSDTSNVSQKKTYHQTGKGAERWGELVTSDAQKGKISCYLKNTGNYRGKNTNLRITFMDWPDYCSADGQRYYPLLGVQLAGDFFGLQFLGIWYEVKMEILDDQGNPLAVNMTYRAEDLDFTQFIGVKKSDGIAGIAVAEDSRVYVSDKDGFYNFYAGAVESNENNEDSVQIQYGKISSFTLRVGEGHVFREGFGYYEYAPDSLIRSYALAETHMAGEGSIDAADDAHVIPGWIAGSAKGYGPYYPPKPAKSVSETEVHGEENFYYDVNFTVPECQTADYYEYLTMTDTLPEAVTVDSISSVKVYDADNSSDATGRFHVTVENGVRDKVTVSAKNPKDSWLYGKSIDVRIKVHKRPEYVFKNSNIVSNTAYLKTELGEVESNPVKTSFYYEITTEVLNGTITPSDMKVPAGGSMEVRYSPDKGCLLQSVTVDQTAADKEAYDSQYSFSNVNADHHVKVVYMKNPVITVTKEVDGCRTAFGTPTFVFKITGTDVNGNARTFYETLSFPEMKNEEKAKKSFTLKPGPGKWTVTEVEVSRYVCTGIKDVVNGSVSGQKVILNIQDHDSAAVTFSNKLTNYRNYNHNDLAVNQFGKQVK